MKKYGDDLKTMLQVGQIRDEKRRLPTSATGAVNGSCA